MDSHLLKTKSIEQIVSDVEHGGKTLRRSLSAWDLTLLGIGAIIGTGIFVLTGTAAANQAGPGDHGVLPGSRACVRVRSAVLRRVRVDGADRRQRLYLRLRLARRDRGVADRLGSDPRVRGRLDDGGDRLERLHAAAPVGRRHRAAGVDERRALDQLAGRDHQPAGSDHRAASSWCCWSSACARAHASTPPWSPSRAPPSSSSSPPASRSCGRRTGRRLRRTAGPAS